MEINKAVTALIGIMAMLMAGCATDPKEIQAAYVSPMLYKDYDCDQVVLEMTHVSQRASELQGNLQKKADGDEAQMGIGLVLFWPVLFALDGDGPDAQEYARLKGTMEALRTVAVQKRCDLDLRNAEGASDSDMVSASTASTAAAIDRSSVPATLSCSRCLGISGCPFVDNGNGTVTDQRTNLIWMRCSYGQKWDGSTCAGNAKEILHDRAIAEARYVHEGGGNWRLPYDGEFGSIIAPGCFPAVNSEVFPNTPPGEYVTQTNVYKAGFFDMKNGASYTASATFPAHVRFVRPGPR